MTLKSNDMLQQGHLGTLWQQKIAMTPSPRTSFRILQIAEQDWYPMYGLWPEIHGRVVHIDTLSIPFNTY